MKLGRKIEGKLKVAPWKILGQLLASGRKPPVLPVDLNTIKSVLVIRPDRLGDVVLSTPVYASIKRSLPEARVTALVDRATADVLKDNPFIEETLILDRKSPWKVIRQIMRNRYDLALNLNKQFSATASLLTLFSRARLRVGYQHPENAWAYDIRVPVGEENRHEIQNNLELLRALDLPEILPAPQLHFNDAEVQKVDRLLAGKRTFPDRPLVLIKPGTRISKWGWAMQNFHTVANHLIESGAAEVFILQGPGEDEWINPFMQNMKHPAVLLPLLPIRELALAIKNADLLLCNHTGIMHLASAVQTPVLAIFKHGNSQRWGPVNTPHVVLNERGGDELKPHIVIDHILRLLIKSA